MRYLMGEECLSVNSCGGLFYFNKEHAPEGATAYCSDCPHLDCIYKAQTIYTSETGRGFSVYFTTREKTDENILADLAKTQYDRCVFGCDNDVVDHQVTIMQFANGKTACHTMSAFSKEVYRDLKIYGTKAELVGVIENNAFEVRYFGGEVEHITYLDVSIESHLMSFVAEESRINGGKSCRLEK